MERVTFADFTEHIKFTLNFSLGHFSLHDFNRLFRYVVPVLKRVIVHTLVLGVLVGVVLARNLHDVAA